MQQPLHIREYELDKYSARQVSEWEAQKASTVRSKRLRASDMAQKDEGMAPEMHGKSNHMFPTLVMNPRGKLYIVIHIIPAADPICKPPVVQNRGVKTSGKP